ncbi:MAG: DUF1302 family protein, partial [Stenotrophobium sp.]
MDMKHSDKMVLLAGICVAAIFSGAAIAQDDSSAASAPASAEAVAPAADTPASAPADAAASSAPDAAATAAPDNAATPDAAASPDAAAVPPDAVASAPADASATAPAYAASEGAPEAAPQQSWFGSMFSNFDFNLGGFIRPEVSFSTGTANPNNQNGNPYDRISVQRTAYAPPTAATTVVSNVLGLAVPLPQATTWSSVPLAVGTTPLGPNTAGMVERPVEYTHDIFNLHILRGELEMGMKLTSDLKVIGRLRAIVDPGHYRDFDAGSLSGLQGGITGGNQALYGSKPNYFQYQVEGDNHPNPLEWDGANYQVYFPTLALDYNHGPLNVRLGNQQIAWGQAIFFRVLDVPDGLDLRRHSLLDYAQEEFSDKRVPSLAARIGYQFTDALLADGFVQKFQPTVFGNPNTQYNIIPVQFTVHDLYSEGGYKDKLSYGLRFKGDFGKWGFQAMATRRYNPDGVFRWTQSGVNKDLPATFPDGSMNTLGTVVNLSSTGGHSGPALATTPFEASPGGVYSASEWFHYAAMVRLNGLTGLNASINEFQPGTGKVFASPVTNYQDAYNELNTFFLAAGGSLRGHIARQYFAENDFGLGGSYVTDGAPGSILDQLIINVEATYTPNRVFTAPSLSGSFLTENNLIGALVLEKYQRFSQSFPATYFVLQYMHRTKDDIFGRSLQGYGGTDTSVASGVSGGSNYVVFAFQQPFPQDIYRIGFATLYDPRGGILVQPGIQWKPKGSLSLDFFYTYINGHLHGNPNNNALSSIDFADEATVR